MIKTVPKIKKSYTSGDFLLSYPAKLKS